MDRPLLALVAILKNEAESIDALLESVKGICDHVTIFDSGSTDGTVAKIEAFGYPNTQVFHGTVVPFEGITDRTVIDFAATRNKSLELEQSRSDAAVFTLCMSGDETLQDGAMLRAFLEKHRDAPEGAYCVTMQRDNATWPYTRVLRVDSNWRYEFPIHETPVGPNGETMGPLVPGARILYAPTDNDRLMTRMKEVDLPVLTCIAERSASTHQEIAARARALLFLAQTHENLALQYSKDEAGGPWLSHQMAAMAFYWRRADLGGDPQEVGFSMLHYFDCADRIGHIYSHEEMIPRLQQLAKMDPDRPEVRYKLALHASQVDVRQAAFFAADAVKVARAAKDKPLLSTMDDRVEWLSLHICAEAAKVMGMTEAAHKFAMQGLEAGGPQAAFAEFL